MIFNTYVIVTAAARHRAIEMHGSNDCIESIERALIHPGSASSSNIYEVNIETGVDV